MSIMRHAPAPTSSELQAEAAHVERLRRHIAEMPAKGETASPQMLAEFARAQKSYLDRKIEFEKLKRAEGAAIKISSGVRETPENLVDVGIPAPASFATPPPKVTPVSVADGAVAETSQTSKVPVPTLPARTGPSKNPMIWMVAVAVIVALATAAFLMLR